MTDTPALAHVTAPTAVVATVARRRDQRRAIGLLAAYGLILALIAFWPVPLDRGASGLLRAISQVVPWLTYDVIETTANVALFVPFGVLLALALPLDRGLVVPLALLATLAIESGQALFLAERTPSLRDVVANVVGAGIGLAIVRVVERRAHLSPSRERPSAPRGSHG